MFIFKKNQPIKTNIANNGNKNLLKTQFRAPTTFYEMLAILLTVISIVWLLALITHSNSDDIWLKTNDSKVVHNSAGYLGARISEFSLAWFGVASFTIPLILFLIAIASFKQYHTTKRLNYAILLSRGLGFLLLLILVAGFISNNARSLDGGWIGVMINESLSSIFGQLVDLVYIGLVMLSLSMSGYWSWFVAFDKTGRLLVSIWQRILAYLSYKRLLKSQKKQLQSTKKERQTLINAQKASPLKSPVISQQETAVKLGKSVKLGQQIDIFDQANQLPTLSLLDPLPIQSGAFSKEELDRMSRQVEMKLKDFGFDVEIETVTPGPVVTQFELHLAAGVKVAQIINLSKDLARALLVESVRIVDVIVGKPLIGLEIPNAKRELIALKQILSSAVFENSKSPLSIALGKDINGNPIVADLAKMPHLLLAGATGMGKSVGLNAIILSIIYKSTPKIARFIMIDPKVVELAAYADVPHLLAPVITNMNEAAGALRWTVGEMERRYQLLAEFGVRNIEGLNKKIQHNINNSKPLLDPFLNADSDDANATLKHLPLIVIIIDEYADMLGALAQEDRTKSKHVEALIIRLAQKARAAGIHLVIATQRPSVDVITGLIKSNIPTRIAFRVSSKIDSRTILDQGGAEQLLGMGDMLYMTTGQTQLRRIHGAFVSDGEVNRITNVLRQQAKPDYTDAISQVAADEPTEAITNNYLNSNKEKDPMYDQAVQVVLESNRASISGLQRRLRIGYNRAARIIEDMETAGIVSPMNANGNREIIAPNN